MLKEQQNNHDFVVKPAPLHQQPLLLPPIDSVQPKLNIAFRDEKVDSAPSKSQAITNPSAFFLDGVQLDKIPPSKCRLINCNGPMSNDYDLHLEQSNHQDNSACHSTFVPLNGCLDVRGNSMGMVSIDLIFNIYL